MEQSNPYLDKINKSREFVLNILPLNKENNWVLWETKNNVNVYYRKEQNGINSIRSDSFMPCSLESALNLIFYDWYRI